jgi:protein TonB
MLFAAFQRRPALFRIAALVLVTLAFAGCNKEKPGAAPGASPDAAAAAAAPPPAVADKVSAMSADQLREAAGGALRQQRLYAPAGDNAMEYYLALRDKQPSDPAVSSALTDLMPYALIATEQSISRNDYQEALRLYALMEKTDPRAPALPRLKQSITEGQLAAKERADEQKVEAADAVARQAELEKTRIAEQQQAQKDAAEKFAAQQEADRQAAVREAAPQRPAPQRAEPAAPPPSTAPVQQQPAAPAPTASNTLRPVSTPAPNYPREAERRRRAGTVEVEFTVGTDGSVTSSRVVSASPPRVFDREALSAVNRWRFQPVGSPVTTRRTIEFKPAN